MSSTFFWLGAIGFSILKNPPTFVEKLRLKGCLVLWYLDDFLISAGKEGSARSCEEASLWIQDLMDTLGLQRHATKGIWGLGTTKLDHLAGI